MHFNVLFGDSEPINTPMADKADDATSEGSNAEALIHTGLGPAETVNEKDADKADVVDVKWGHEEEPVRVVGLIQSITVHARCAFRSCMISFYKLVIIICFHACMCVCSIAHVVHTLCTAESARVYA